MNKPPRFDPSPGSHFNTQGGTEDKSVVLVTYY
jgi:hypothetical protein